MNTSEAFRLLGQFALLGAARNERVHVYESLAALGDRLFASEPELANISNQARHLACDLRATDRAQLQFRDLLRGETHLNGARGAAARQAQPE